jgi:hypothetical protein
MTLKAILSLAFLAALAYSAIKIIPVYVDNYQMQDFIQSQTPFWLAQRATKEAVLKSILAKAQDLNLPVAAEDVTLEVGQNKVSVSIDVHVPVDLKVYTLPLHFTDTSENRSL